MTENLKELIDAYLAESEKNPLPPFYAFVDNKKMIHGVDEKSVQKIAELDKSMFKYVLQAFKAQVEKEGHKVESSVLIHEVFMRKIKLEGGTPEEREEAAKKLMNKYAEEGSRPSMDIQAEEAIMIILENKEGVETRTYSIEYDTKTEERIINKIPEIVTISKDSKIYNTSVLSDSLLGIMD